MNDLARVESSTLFCESSCLSHQSEHISTSEEWHNKVDFFITLKDIVHGHQEITSRITKNIFFKLGLINQSIVKHLVFIDSFHRVNDFRFVLPLNKKHFTSASFANNRAGFKVL
jgi:hypothetical protein